MRKWSRLMSRLRNEDGVEASGDRGHQLFPVAALSCKTEDLNCLQDSVTDSLNGYISIYHPVFFLRGPRGEQSNAASTLQVLSEEERRVSAIPHRLTFLIFNKKITPGLQIFPSIIHLRMQTIDQWCADYTIHYFIQFKRFQWEILNFDYKFIFHLCFLDLPCLTSLVF